MAEGLCIPYALPREEVKAQVTSKNRAEMVEILTPSPDRRAAPCRHFGQCGGCSVQHLQPAAYTAWKSERMRQMLRRLQVADSALQHLVECGAGNRRRATLAVAADKQGVRLGFHAPRSHQVVEISECLVVDPALLALLAPLREVIAQLKKPHLLTQVQWAQLPEGEGTEIIFHASATLHQADRALLAQWAQTHRIERLYEQSGTETRRLYGTQGIFPPGAFQQASAAGQQAITNAVLHSIGAASAVVDIYAGCGTYSLPLAKAGKRIHAVEGAAEMVAALHNLALRHGVEDRLNAEQRDLYRNPLSASELAAFDAAIINPPHNGATPQIRALAASGIENVVMVSCNPATFERDARLLLEAGYELASLTPIDQFIWSGHLEVVGVFRLLQSDTKRELSAAHNAVK